MIVFKMVNPYGSHSYLLRAMMSLSPLQNYQCHMHSYCSLSVYSIDYRLAQHIDDPEHIDMHRRRQHVDPKPTTGNR